MKRLLRLYPRAWRRRYEPEMQALLDDLPPRPGMALDLVRGAGREHLKAALDRVAPTLQTAGGPPMPTHRLQRHPTASALLAALIMAPSLALVILSFLAYQLAVPGLASIVEPGLRALDAWPRLVDLYLLAAPALAFVVAAAPLVGVSLARGDGELRVAFTLRARRLNIAVLVVAILVGGLLYGHILSEFLLERP
jgi:hypothetical protein